jgi:hypothetical protein
MVRGGVVSDLGVLVEQPPFKVVVEFRTSNLMADGPTQPPRVVEAKVAIKGQGDDGMLDELGAKFGHRLPSLTLK